MSDTASTVQGEILVMYICGEGFDCNPFQDIDFVVEGRHSGLARPCCSYYRLASRAVEVGLKWCARVDGMVMYVQWTECVSGASQTSLYHRALGHGGRDLWEMGIPHTLLKVPWALLVRWDSDPMQLCKIDTLC